MIPARIILAETYSARDKKKKNEIIIRISTTEFRFSMWYWVLRDRAVLTARLVVRKETTSHHEATLSLSWELRDSRIENKKLGTENFSKPRLLGILALPLRICHVQRNGDISTGLSSCLWKLRKNYNAKKSQIFKSFGKSLRIDRKRSFSFVDMRILHRAW